MISLRFFFCAGLLWDVPAQILSKGFHKKIKQTCQVLIFTCVFPFLSALCFSIFFMFFFVFFLLFLFFCFSLCFFCFFFPSLFFLCLLFFTFFIFVMFLPFLFLPLFSLFYMFFLSLFFLFLFALFFSVCVLFILFSVFAQNTNSPKTTSSPHKKLPSKEVHCFDSHFCATAVEPLSTACHPCAWGHARNSNSTCMKQL